MTLRLYADECVDARIVAGLRRRQVDVVTAADAGLVGERDDARHLAYAINLGRLVLTADHDFLRLARDHSVAGTPFPGILFIAPETAVGQAIPRDCSHRHRARTACHRGLRSPHCGNKLAT